jgi:hypothetical protein
MSEPRTVDLRAALRHYDERIEPNKSTGEMSAREWRDAYFALARIAIKAAEASRIDVPPETEAVRRCVTHHACVCHERLAEIGRRYIKACEAEP